MGKLFLITFLIICYSSCGRSSIEAPAKTNSPAIIGGPVIIESLGEIEKSLEIKALDDNISVSQVFDSVHYLILESNEISLFGNISKLVSNDERIYILDGVQKCILCFQKSGEFVSMYQSVGRGPLEYININDFDILPDKKGIVLLTDFENLVYLSNDLVFEKEVNLPFKSGGVMSISSELLAFYTAQWGFGVDSTNNRYLLLYYDLNSLTITGLFPNTVAQRIYLSNNYSLYRSASIIFNFPLSYDFYFIDKDGLKSNWRFDFLSRNIDMNKVDKFSDINNFNNLLDKSPELVVLVTDIFHSEDLLSFMILTGDEKYYGFFNASNNTSLCGKEVKNDFTGIPYGRPVGVIDNYFVTFVPARQIVSLPKNEVPTALRDIRTVR